MSYVLNITNVPSSAGGNTTGVFPLIIYSLVDPQEKDFQYVLGQQWMNTGTKEMWYLGSRTNNIGIWIRFGGGSGTVTEFPVDITGTQNPVLPNGAGQVQVTSSDGTIDVTGNTNQIDIVTHGGQAATNFPVDITGTQNPVLPDADGEVEVTSPDGTLDITGNTNQIAIVNHGGQAITKFDCDITGTQNPVLPDVDGQVQLTSSLATIAITGNTAQVDYNVIGSTWYMAQTTDATPLALATFAVTADTAATLFVELTSADSVLAQSLHCSAAGGGRYPTAGALALSGTPMVNITTNFETATVDIIASGNNLVVSITGEAGTTINWKANVRLVSL